MKKEIEKHLKAFDKYSGKADKELNKVLSVLKENGLNKDMAIQETTDGPAIIFNHEHPFHDSYDSRDPLGWTPNSEFFLSHVLEGKHPEIFGEWE